MADDEGRINANANAVSGNQLDGGRTNAISSGDPFLLQNSDSPASHELSFPKYTEQFYTLESTLATANYAIYSSPSSISSSRSDPFSPQSFDAAYNSPLSTLSTFDDENKLVNALWRNELLGPYSDLDTNSSLNASKYNSFLQMAPHMDLKQLLITCAKTISEADTFSLTERQVSVSAAEALMDVLEKRVSVSGEPLQRLGAYMLEGLRARLLSSGSIIYKKLKCKEPTGPQLMSYMHVLFQMCPYYKFAYTSANVAISEAMKNENRIHIIDFQIAQGTQWVDFIQDISKRAGKPPHIRITGVDDSESVHARGGSLDLVSQRLRQVAQSCGVSFEFQVGAISGCEVRLGNLEIRPEEALALNFPYILHHMPDESVTTTNHRDRLLRLVKGLSPRIVTLVEQESNTNTSTFFKRFIEALDYYTAMFESIDAARPRNDKQRINAEEHCVAKDVVNIIACEGNDRVERHELFGKWRLRLMMAGFEQVQLSSKVGSSVRDMLKEYSPNYRVAEGNGALYLGWKNRALASCSAWR